MTLTRADLETRRSTGDSKKLVDDALAAAGAFPDRWALFFARYTAWNGDFGSQVARLAGRIGGSEAFLDAGEPNPELADRSVFVASYFFDAARDEFDDRDTKHRDTHRCLAQALLSGTLSFAEKAGSPLTAARLTRPTWLQVLRQRVRAGYGAGFPEQLPFLCRAMGYHLGSEVLADQEFSTIDSYLRKNIPDLVGFLDGHEVEIAGQAHNAYRWLFAHSGHGGGAEADHFAWAVQGVDHAFRYVPPHLADDLREQVLLGYVDFANDHHEFFTRIVSEFSR